MTIKKRIPYYYFTGKRTYAILGGLFLFSCFISLFLPFPELTAFQNRDWSTRVFDRNGTLIQILPLEEGMRREYTAPALMPPEVIRIFIESEDKHFYTHSGIDVSAIVRAGIQNIRTGKRVSGASTITMQLARMIIPARKRTFFSKIREAWNALRIEQRLSKEEILSLYLNSLPFGFQTEGVASAARTFFSVPLERLTPEQLCCLAVIPRRPSDFNPLKNPLLCAQKAAVLYSAVYNTDTGNTQHTASSPEMTAKQTVQHLLKAAKTARAFDYPFYLPHYTVFLKQQYRSGAFCTHRPPDAQSIPLPPDWYLTIDMPLSMQCEALLKNELKKHSLSRIHNGAVFAIENETGNVLVWVGSNSYFDSEHSGQVDGVTARNQSGSSTKPFLYALALERGWKPSDILADIPLRFGEEEAYIPRNFNNRYNGPIRFRTALASSLNVPAVQLLKDIGEEHYHNQLQKLHVSIDTERTHPGLSLALGSVPVSLYELVRAFSVFPRDGIIIPLSHFRRESSAPPDTDKYRLFSSEWDGFDAAPVYTPDTARLMCSILSDSSARVKGFGFNTVFRTPFPSLFKTGTANQYQSLIALAASPQYTVGVWLGNFSGNTVIGKTGSSIPAFIAKELLVALHDRTDADSTGHFIGFQKPEHWHLHPVCALSGMPASPDCPNVIMEYLPDSWMQTASAGECCSWHLNTGAGLITQYPEEYQQWFITQKRYGQVVPNASPLTVLRPAPNSFYVYDPLYAGISVVPIDIIGGKEDYADIFYDGKHFGTLSRPFSGQLPMERGTHRLMIRCGEEVKECSFTVK